MLFSCKTNIRALAAFHVVVGVASLLMNALVILVTCKKKSLQNSQSSFKVSLAIADVIYAAVIIPSILYNLLSLTRSPFAIKEANFGKNESFLFSRFVDVYSKSYVEFFGSVYFTCLMASLYTLLLAAADRLFAVARPFTYRTLNTKRISKRACAAVWLFCVFVATLPLYTKPSLSYTVFFGALFTMTGFEAETVYIVVLGLPFLLMIGTSIATFCYTRKHTRKAKRLHSKKSRSDKKPRNIEVELAKTLIQMVTAFSLMTLPLIVVIIATIATPNLSLHKPRSLDLESFLALYSLEFIGYVCLTCATIWNFLIYNVKNVKFRNNVYEIMAQVSKKLGFSFVIEKIRTSEIASSSVFTKKTKASVSSTVPSPKEKFEMAPVGNVKDSVFESFHVSLHPEEVGTAVDDVMMKRSRV